MYEPTYLPRMEASLLRDLRFGILYSNRAVRPGDPDIEPLHIHEYLEIFFNISSDVSFLVNNRLYPVRMGEAVISRANDLHVCIYNKTAVHEYFCLWIDAGENSALPSLFSRGAPSPLLSFDEDTQKKLTELLFSLGELCENGGKCLEKTACLANILCLLSRSDSPQKQQIPLPPALQTILDDINDSFSSIHSVNQLLSKHFISSATLNRWFRKYIHSSPREYLESKKLSHAVRLLTEGASVTDACMRSGFSDCSHFIALFKRKFGETPLKYKRRNGGS